MPPQTPKSGLMAKYGAKLDEAVKAHASDDAPARRGSVPPGIRNGVAKLVKCGFAQYKTGKNVGEWYFRAEGRMVEPKSITNSEGREEPVEGLSTSIMEAVCQTSSTDGKKVTTIKQHTANILGFMKALAGSEYGQGATGADLERLAADLEATATPPAKPIYFWVNTSVRKAMNKGDSDGVWENWNGTDGLEEYVQPDGQDTQDETGGEEGGAPEEQVPFEEPPQGEVEEPAAEEQAEEPQTQDEGSGDEPPVDLEALAAAADGGDEEAQIKLAELAAEAGMDQATIEAYDPWSALAQAILETATGGEEAPEEAPAEEPEPPKPAPKPVVRLKQPPGAAPKPAAPASTVPKMKGVFRYQQLGADKKPLLGKDKKPKKPIEVEVTAVDAAKKTVNLKSLDDPKLIWKAIPWASLLPSNAK